MKKQVSLPAVIGLVLIVAVVSAVSVWAIATLKTIHGTSFVIYRGDITIEDFKFVDDNTVAITITTNLSPTPTCTIRLTGAGISGSVTLPSGWTSPHTVNVAVTGTLIAGTITIEVT